jgi:DNA-binding transcriptional LysR family regulator
VRLDLRVGRSQELADAFDQGSLDVVLTMRASASLHERHVFTLPMLWLGASTLERGSMELPLALLDPPCGFRVAALSALDQARRPYRIAVASPSLSGLRAAVRAGIAVTARTALMVDRDVIDASEQLGLPPLPQAQFALRARDDASPAVAHLIELMCTELAALPKASGRD